MGKTIHFLIILPKIILLFHQEKGKLFVYEPYESAAGKKPCIF
jgi:hypothetical protein